MTRSQEMQLHLKSESNLVAVHDFGDSGKCINFKKSDRCDKVSFTWAALPGAHILTDVHSQWFLCNNGTLSFGRVGPLPSGPLTTELSPISQNEIN